MARDSRLKSWIFIETLHRRSLEVWFEIHKKERIDLEETKVKVNEYWH
jgi:hypothetical protein